MRKVVFLLVTFLLPILVCGQSKKVNELGFVFTNPDQFGLTYRIGNEHGMWRFNGLNLSGNYSTSTHNTTVNTSNTLGFGVSVGREFRLPINHQVDFRYGADLLFTYSKNYTETEETGSFIYSEHQTIENKTPGVCLVFGLNLNLKYFIVGAELKPSIQYNFGSTDNTEGTNPTEHKAQTGLVFGLSNLPVQFSIVYPF